MSISRPDSDLETKRRLRLNPRITVLVIVLILAISAAVILTDILSPRNRHPQPAAATATPRTPPLPSR